MLPKRFRLTKSEFQAVRDHGQLYSARLMGILISPSGPSGNCLPPSSPSDPSNPSFAKAGLIVSRRLSPKAVIRSRLKRRLRAALQRILPQISPNLHLVVLPNRRALAASVSGLEKEIRQLLFAHVIPSDPERSRGGVEGSSPDVTSGRLKSLRHV